MSASKELQALVKPHRPQGAPKRQSRHVTRHKQRRDEEALLLSLAAQNLEDLTQLTEEDLEIAFDFLDVHGTGELTLYSLRERLAAFYSSPDLVPIRELKLLVGEHKTLRLADLRSILQETNELLHGTRIDPVKEVFKTTFDPNGTGEFCPASLRALLQRLGHRGITDEDLHVLLEAIDADGDGAVGLDDFRALVGLENAKADRALVHHHDEGPQQHEEEDQQQQQQSGVDSGGNEHEGTFLTS